MSGDRVNAENFAQHAEHYTRILAEAQREVDRVREEQEQFNRDRQAERDRDRDRDRSQRMRGPDEGAADPAAMDQPDVASSPLGADPFADSVAGDAGDSGLIDLPEGRPAFLDARGRNDQRARNPERRDRQTQDRQPQDRQPQDRQSQDRPPHPRRRPDDVVQSGAPVETAAPDSAAAPAPAGSEAKPRAPRVRKPRAPRADGDTPTTTTPEAAE